MGFASTELPIDEKQLDIYTRTPRLHSLTL